MHFALSNKKVVRDYNLSVELMLLNCGVGEDLRVPWTARRSNQSILKQISPENSLKGLMLKLKLPTPWPPDVKKWLIGKDPDAGKDWRQEEKGITEDEMASPTQGTWVWVNSRSWWWTGRPCSPWGRKELDTTERLDWTKLKGNIHSQTGVNESLIQINV